MEGRLSYGIVTKVWEALTSTPPVIAGLDIGKSFSEKRELLRKYPRLKAGSAIRSTVLYREDRRREFSTTAENIWGRVKEVEDLLLWMVAGDPEGYTGLRDSGKFREMDVTIDKVIAQVLFENWAEILADKDPEASWEFLGHSAKTEA